MNVAVILAGGSGSRFGADKPKQFLTVAGKTIMEHTLDAFSKNKNIDEICIVSRADWVDEVKEIVARGGYTKVKNVTKGGKERYHSTLAALAIYTRNDDNLFIHDCVRPLVSQRIINDCAKALQQYDAVDVAVPTTDTIIELNEDGCISRIPQRKMLRNVQTPQCFRRGTLAKAFSKAVPEFMPTDDCSVVHTYLPEVPIHVVEGEMQNIKITFPEDILFAEKVFSTQM